MPNSSASNPSSETLLSFRIRAAQQLNDAGIDNPEYDVQLLMSHALHLDRGELFSQQDRFLNPQDILRLQSFITRRAEREPVARILGAREFWGLSFSLNQATLEPRPDSETLVEAALKALPIPNPLILDLGTGTGCLLLALLHQLPLARGLGIDHAPRAIEQAQCNAEYLGLSDRARFKSNNWCDGIEERFDLIISNPPYIAHDDIAELMPEVRDHDPLSALDGGKDGLDSYRALIPQFPRILKEPHGIAVMEIAQGQATPVRALFTQSGFTNIKIHQDLGNIERCITASHSKP